MIISTAIAATVINVASFNLRFDVAKDTGDNAWEVRRPRVVSVIKSGGFDIIGFQELSKTMRPGFLPLIDGYRVSDEGMAQTMVPIAYRKDRFELVEAGRFALAENTNDFKNACWEASSHRSGEWVLLKERESGRLIRVFNSHPDWKSQKARSLGMEKVIVRLAKAAEARGEFAIITGDMNEDPGIPRPKYTPEDPEHPWGEGIDIAKRSFDDAYDRAKSRSGTESSCHGFKNKDCGRIDRIFLPKGTKVLSYTTHNDRPGGGYPSDHDAISARIAIDEGDR